MYRRQHPQGEAVDFQDAQRVDVVLVPFDEGSVGHSPVFDRDHLAQRSACDDESADVLREMTGKADDLPDQLAEHTYGSIGRIDPRLAHEGFGQDVLVPPVVLFGEHADVIE